jgi:hypothetical protein
MTLSIKTLSITKFSIRITRGTQDIGRALLCRVLIMLSVTVKPNILIAVMLIAVMVIVVVPNRFFQANDLQIFNI